MKNEETFPRRRNSVFLVEQFVESRFERRPTQSRSTNKNSSDRRSIKNDEFNCERSETAERSSIEHRLDFSSGRLRRVQFGQVTADKHVARREGGDLSDGRSADDRSHSDR